MEVVELVEFVKGVLDEGDVSICFDRRMGRFSDKEVIQVMKSGIICAAEEPEKRLSMGEVVQFLESIRGSGGGDS